jgi:hypothetical protein
MQVTLGALGGAISACVAEGDKAAAWLASGF